MVNQEYISTNPVSFFQWIKAWVLASRPKTLPIWLGPVFVGSLINPIALNQLRWNLVFWSLCVTLFLQIGIHYINDYFDHYKGADTDKRLGPVRGIQLKILNPKYVYIAGLACLGAVLLCGIPLVEHGGPSVLILLIISVIFAYCYSGGPWPLAYLGIADAFVFVFFGWVNVMTTGYFQTGQMAFESFLAGTQIGLLSVVLLVITNFRDRLNDSEVNKRTLAVRFGAKFARWELTVVSLLPYILLFCWIPISLKAALLPSLTLPLSLYLLRKIWTTEASRKYNAYIPFAALLPILFGILLIVGYRL